ncbi:DNA-binding transcriptional MocR family regulator [Bradyrhizobium sp. i1.7.7]
MSRASSRSSRLSGRGSTSPIQRCTIQTGATISLQTAHRLLTAATTHDLTIIEDDIFGDFEPERSPRLAALDGLNRVIRIGSFSKTLSASVRCGYIAGRADWIEHLVDLQVATSFGGPSPVATEIIARVLAGGSYRKHMDELRQKLTRTRRDVARKLQALGIEPWLMPRGGFFLWCRLAGGQDATAVARAALEVGCGARTGQRLQRIADGIGLPALQRGAYERSANVGRAAAGAEGQMISA